MGANIAERRKLRGWTQAALAERLDVDAETISRFERGATLPSLLTLERISACLRVRVGELLTESSAQPDAQATILSAWLADLDERDRDFVLELVKSACDHLRRA
ncbi:MAG: helix-turn-helix transcriptional regulator [Thermomonas sp.]|uniref:helix-turn-helix domain-containing protein n=1 Tax=Thermomonas sp. TaxID=1971895 RepID=UPI0039E45256